MPYRIYKSIIDKNTDEVLEERILKTIDDRDYALYAMGYLVGKQVHEHGGDPETSIINAQIDDVWIMTPIGKVRYQMILE